MTLVATQRRGCVHGLWSCRCSRTKRNEWCERPSECSCGGAGCIESDYAPGTFYPCVGCNPNWQRIGRATLAMLRSKDGGGDAR